MNQEQTKAWYKQFWPWFLIALPGSVVVASIATIIIASHKPDSIVIDDYYKAGLAINRDLSREQLAARLDIGSTLQINRDNNSIRIIIDASEHTRPKTLHLKLMHPTLPDKDQFIILEQTDSNTYNGKTNTISNGSWNVLLEPGTPSWRIQRRIQVDNINSSYTIR